MAAVAATLAILIRAYVVFGVPAHDLEAARRTADASLRAAGVGTSWIVCGIHPDAEEPPGCATPPEPFELVVHIIGGPDRMQTGSALGHAFVDTGSRHGVLATLFGVRISAIADEAGIDHGVLLGRVLAHEVGHLLLGSPAHGSRGLMREHWTVPELRRDPREGWLFSRLEAAKIRARLQERQHAPDDGLASLRTSGGPGASPGASQWGGASQ